MPARRHGVARFAPALASILTAVPACLPLVANAIALDDYRWQNRLLVVAAPGPTDPALRDLCSRLEREAAGVAARDLVVLRLLEHGESHAGRRVIDSATARELRARLGLAAGERMLLLVGKDGGVKRRGPLHTALPEIFRQIDAMPMRRAEMHEREENGAGTSLPTDTPSPCQTPRGNYQPEEIPT
jgi:hypothetical protein